MKCQNPTNIRASKTKFQRKTKIKMKESTHSPNYDRSQENPQKSTSNSRGPQNPVQMRIKKSRIGEKQKSESSKVLPVQRESKQIQIIVLERERERGKRETRLQKSDGILLCVRRRRRREEKTFGFVNFIMEIYRFNHPTFVQLNFSP